MAFANARFFQACSWALDEGWVSEVGGYTDLHLRCALGRACKAGASSFIPEEVNYNFARL